MWIWSRIRLLLPISKSNLNSNNPKASAQPTPVWNIFSRPRGNANGPSHVHQYSPPTPSTYPPGHTTNGREWGVRGRKPTSWPGIWGFWWGHRSEPTLTDRLVTGSNQINGRLLIPTFSLHSSSSFPFFFFLTGKWTKFYSAWIIHSNFFFVFFFPVACEFSCL